MLFASEITGLLHKINFKCDNNVLLLNFLMQGSLSVLLQFPIIYLLWISLPFGYQISIHSIIPAIQYK